MELLDTSALIVSWRRPELLEWLRRALTDGEVAICDPVALEYLRGARNASEFTIYEQTLRSLPWLSVLPADWDRAVEVSRAMSFVAGGYQRSVGIPDLLIAATAERHGVAVVHYDADYDRIAGVTGQATRWIVPAGSVEA
jgi:hypothetical protein